MKYLKKSPVAKLSYIFEKMGQILLRGGLYRVYLPQIEQLLSVRVVGKKNDYNKDVKPKIKARKEVEGKRACELGRKEVSKNF